MSKVTVIDQIRQLLAQRRPLSITSTREIFTSLLAHNAGLLNHTVREAVQKISLGSPTAKRRNTQIYFAIYLTIPEMKDALGRDDIILTLPGIEKKFIEHMSSDYVTNVKKKLSPDYDKEAIEYWVQSAQLRSVDVITAKEKKAVIFRDGGKCRICSAILEFIPI
jgi:hypothetical protein